MGVYQYDKDNDELKLIAGGLLYADSPVGSIIPYGGTTAPTGWLICQGQAVSRNTYAELFTVIGTAFGSGDGSTTFNIPDLRETIPVGVGENDIQTIANHDVYTLGEFKDDNLGKHDHPLVVTTRATYNTAGVPVGVGNNNTPTTATHGKQLGVNYIIKAKHTPVPTDFMDAIQSMNDWKSIWTGNVLVPSTDGIQNTLVSGLSLSGYRQVCLILDNTNGHRNPSRIIIDNVYGFGDSYGSYRRSSLYGSCWGFEAFFTDGKVTGEYTVEGWTTFSVNLVQILAR